MQVAVPKTELEHYTSKISDYTSFVISTQQYYFNS